MYRLRPLAPPAAGCRCCADRRRWRATSAPSPARAHRLPHRARSLRNLYTSTAAADGDGGGPYTLLGVTPGAGADEIKAAFRRRAMESHPDRVPPGAPACERAAALVRFQVRTSPASMTAQAVRAFDLLVLVRPSTYATRT
jgi:hypothetical protein